MECVLLDKRVFKQNQSAHFAHHMDTIGTMQLIEL